MSHSLGTKKCIFDCNKEDSLEKASDTKIESIISASKTRNDQVHITLETHALKNPNLEVYCHRNCFSTYTSKTHITRTLKRSLSHDESEHSKEQTRKRLLRSQPIPFNFKRDCLFCSEECIERDPKNPNRYNVYYLVRTLEVKSAFLDTCVKRSDKWGNEVQLRILGASSDLIAAEARYHQRCLSIFTSYRNINAVKNKKCSSIPEENDNLAFNEVLQEMNINSSKTWNSIQLHSLYLSFGGSTLSRRAFVQRLQDHFGKELLVLSSIGFASLILFRKTCTTELLITNDDSDVISEYVKPLANIIKEESITVPMDNSKYNLRINTKSIKTECSRTFMELLKELDIPQLAALTICSMVTSCLKSVPSQLQIAFGNLIEKKSTIEKLSHFKITTTYDEHRRFRASVAKACDVDYSLRGIEEGNGLIQVVADNFDANIHSENGLKQTHSMGMILTKYPSVNSSGSKELTVPRLPKNEVSLVPDVNVHVERYQGPKKVQMPTNFVVKDVHTLKSLALRAYQKDTLMRAQSEDFMFLKAMSQDSNTPEYNGFNSKRARETLPIVDATQVMYLPLIDQPPTNHDTVLTTMMELRRITNECGQSFTVFTADQAIYKVVIDIIWNDQDHFSDFVPRLGGMHTLMSFIGCVGTLMAGSGLLEILESAFAGVGLMLKGKKYPQNMRALRLVTEEILGPILQNNNVNSFESMMKDLEERSYESRTTRLWVDCLIKPVLLMMNFVRAEREADWCLHVWCVLEMLPYFAAAGHWNYLRYAFVYISYMNRMPKECLDRFLKGEHVMRHKPGPWNGIWSDQMIESTFMRYGHGERGSSMTGITMNTAAVKRWALNMHATS